MSESKKEEMRNIDKQKHGDAHRKAVADAAQHHGKHKHGPKLATEYERHVGGFGNLGPQEPHFSVNASALSGDVTPNTPRFL